MSLSPVSQERLRIYSRFRNQLDALNANEASANAFCEFLSARPANTYWVACPYFGDRLTFKVELQSNEKLSEQGPMLELFESLFGAITKTEDDVTEYSMTRCFRTKKAELRIDVPGDSMTCRRVEIKGTEEVVTHKKYRIECQEAAG